MSIKSDNYHIDEAISPEEQARHLHHEITGAGFDMKRFDQHYPIFETLINANKSEKILFQNHLDVVPATAQTWNFDPFGGVIHDSSN